MSLISFLLLSILNSALLVGLIWTIQWVHYPSFSYIEPKLFSLFHGFHSHRISLIVVPLMVGELLLSGLGLWSYSGQAWVWVSATFVAVAWLSTLFLQIPQHRNLALGYEQGLIKRLVIGNYVRTFAWTCKMILLSWIFYQEFR